MNKGIVNFKGLYGDDNSPLLPNFILIEALETRSKLYDWEINEHLHTDLYQLFVIESGMGILVSEQKEIELRGPCIVAIPSNILHGFHFQADICGEVVTFSESYLENLFNNSQILLELSTLKYLPFTEELQIFERLNLLKDQIAKELFDEKPEKQTVLASLFQLLFVSLYRFSISIKSEFGKTDNRSLKYFQTFQKKIKQSLPETKSITHYAHDLNITAVHLNRICQSIIQRSALQVVQDYLIIEAKKYLLNTDYSISEVSYFLNFKDPAYFTRLFKKLTGVNPTEFRRN